MKRPMLWILTMIICYILVLFHHLPQWIFFLSLIFVSLLCFCISKKMNIPIVILSIVILSLGIFRVHSFFALENPLICHEDQKVSARGIVDNIPQTEEGKAYFWLQLLELDGIPIESKIKVTYGMADQEIVPKPGDVVQFNGEIKLGESQRNPGGFDEALYLWGNGFDGKLYSFGEGQLEYLGEKTNFKYWALRVREKLTKLSYQAFSPEVSAVIVGILFGDKGIDDGIKTLFSDAGISHIMAVSGLHVGYVYLLIFGIGKFLKLSSKWRILLLVAGLSFYIALVGFSASIIRASMMILSVGMGEIIKRRVDTLSSLCLAGFVILLINPIQLFMAGFLLSFGAVLGIIFFYQPILFKIRGFGEKLPYFVELMVLTLGATIGTLPILLYFFQNINLVSLLSNLIIVPLSGVLFIMAWIVLPLMWVFPFIMAVLAVIPEGLGRIILWFSHIFSNLPFLQINNGPLSFLNVVIFFLIWLALAGYFRLKSWQLGILIGGIFALSLGMSFLPKPLELTFLDVGQGDSLLISTPNGENYLVDGGGYEGWLEEKEIQPISEKILLPALYSKGITHLDGVFITHNHKDHAQGIEELLTKIPVDCIYVSSKYNGEGLLTQNKIPVVALSQGTMLPLDKSVEMEVLSPSLPMEQWEAERQNEGSLVMRLNYGEHGLLLMGDAPMEVEQVLNPKDIPSQLIKIGHHGSKTSSEENFIKTVNPKIAVISVGKNNSFGHPTSEVLEILNRQGIQIYRTDKNGAVVIQSDGKNLWIDPYIDEIKENK